MNHEKNLKASFLVAAPPAIPGGAAKTQGRALAKKLSPPKSRGSLCPRSAALPNAIASHLSESGHFLVISRANRGGTCARSVPYAGGLALWRRASLKLPHGRPALEAGPNSALLRLVRIWDLARSVERISGRNLRAHQRVCWGTNPLEDGASTTAVRAPGA